MIAIDWLRSCPSSSSSVGTSRDGVPPPGGSGVYSTFTGVAVYDNAHKFTKMDFKSVDKLGNDTPKYSVNTDNGWVAIGVRPAAAANACSVPTGTSPSSASQLRHSSPAGPPAASRSGRIQSGQRLVIVIDDFGGSGWERTPGGSWQASEHSIDDALRSLKAAH